MTCQEQERRAARLLRATLGAGLVVLALVAIGRSPLEGAGFGALGADTERYTNSVHELALAGLRLALGDEPDDVRTPLYFGTRISRSNHNTGIWTAPGGSGRLLGTVPDGPPLLIVAPAEDGWTRVYAPHWDALVMLARTTLLVSRPSTV